MITEIDFKVTGEERKKLAYAIGETLGLLLKLKVLGEHLQMQNVHR